MCHNSYINGEKKYFDKNVNIKTIPTHMVEIVIDFFWQCSQQKMLLTVFTT